MAKSDQVQIVLDSLCVPQTHTPEAPVYPYPQHLRVKVEFSFNPFYIASVTDPNITGSNDTIFRGSLAIQMGAKAAGQINITYVRVVPSQLRRLPGCTTGVAPGMRVTNQALRYHVCTRASDPH